MSALDAALIAKSSELLDRFESFLPTSTGVMAWVYNRESLDVHMFASHRSTDEVMCIVRATWSRLFDAVEGTTRWFEQPGDGAPSAHLVSSATVTQLGNHDRVRMWVRGGLAGELIVAAGDGERMAAAHGLVVRP